MHCFHLGRIFVETDAWSCRGHEGHSWEWAGSSLTGHRLWGAKRLALGLAAALVAGGLAAATPAVTAAAAAPPTLNLKVLLIGEGSSDVTTAAWQSALTSEGVPYTLVTATGLGAQ